MQRIKFSISNVKSIALIGFVCAVFVFTNFPITNTPFVNSVHADHLTLEIAGKTHELDGEILIEAQDKSIFFREIDGRLWLVKANQIKSKIDVEKPVEAISKKEMGERLLKELPDGFRIYETKHYVIAYQNEVAYARWVGGLYESRLFNAFEKFWEKRKKVELTEPAFPLAIVIFGSRPQYQRYVDRELGPGQSMVAYYNLLSNRVTMFDLTSVHGNGQALNDRKISEVLRSPSAVNMVATMIHEATHQLIFNRGMQTRLAESPLWMNEGLAMFFEAPNLRSRRGWQGPGLVFQQRLIRFRRFLSSRPANSLVSLIQSDERLRNQEDLLDAYAESWAFNHFLLNRRSDQYVAYLQFMAQKKALVEDSPETRMADFKKFFKEDLADLDAAFIKYIRKLK
ncbi:MAG: DUF1570 domain-containing protein [Mariniblastus sp.]